MYSCPHCNKPTISRIAKLFVGSAGVKKCSSCDGDWSISWISLFWLSFFIIPTSFSSNLLLIIAGVIVSWVGVVFFTPIVKRN